MGTDPIDAALRRGDIRALRAAFGDPLEFPNVHDACGTWCLTLAVYRAPPALVAALLDAGADPNAPESDGFPTLFAAIDREGPQAERLSVLRLLLDAGADVQQRGINDYTALHYAACRDDAAAVDLLLAHGADPTARTRIDACATPLEEAEAFGHRAGADALRRGSTSA